MKKLFWIIFLIIIICIFDIEAEATSDYSYLTKEVDAVSIISIKVKMNILELINILKDENISLISIRPTESLYNKPIVTKGNDIYEGLDYAIERFTDELINIGFEEKAMYYKVNGFTIDKIKVFGKNGDIYNLTKKLNLV